MTLPTLVRTVRACALGCALTMAATTPAHAAVVTSLSGATSVTIPPVNIANSAGPISFGPGITFTTSSTTARFGWTSAIPQYQAFPWVGTPAIGLNTAEAIFTLTFDNPIQAFLGQITWGTSGYAGFSSRMSAYDANGYQLDYIDFVASGTQLQPRRSYYGFSYAAPQIKSIVFSNDYLAVRNISIIAPSVPEPASWAMMIIGFGMVGGAMRTRRRALASET